MNKEMFEDISDFCLLDKVIFFELLVDLIDDSKFIDVICIFKSFFKVFFFFSNFRFCIVSFLNVDGDCRIFDMLFFMYLIDLLVENIMLLLY